MSSSRESVAALRTEVASLNWFHTIDLGNGIITPGADKTPEKIAALNLPADLRGKSVLDIGAWNGAISFECERRGAARVLATDYYCWHGGVDREGRRGFDIARRALHSRVEDLEIRVEDISPETVGMFDVVLFLGVLYHAEDPLGYLRRVRAVCRDYAIVETLVDALDYPRPALVFYEGRTLNNDPSNFFGPNQLAVEAMCREVGFRSVEKTSFYLGNRMSFIARV